MRDIFFTGFEEDRRPNSQSTAVLCVDFCLPARHRRRTRCHCRGLGGPLQSVSSLSSGSLQRIAKTQAILECSSVKKWCIEVLNLTLIAVLKANALTSDREFQLHSLQARQVR